MVLEESLDEESVLDATSIWSALNSFAPRENLIFLDWCRREVVTDQGRPYDHSAYPHIGAPGGPADGYDNPRTRTQSLQWATRLGKSFYGQCASIKTAKTDPAPQLFVSSNEKLAKEVTARTYAMIHNRPRLNAMLLKKPVDQKQDLIEFRESKVFVGWARSAATLADKNIKFGHANELDDWEHRSTSKDGDPQKLFTDRFKDFQSVRKVIFESVPKVRGRSRIEALRLSGTCCRYFVPCPHCHKYQVLDFKRIEWDRDEQGKHNPALAKATARYVCPHCEGKVLDNYRGWMVRRGVWCPEGCTVDDVEALRIAEHEIARDIGEPRLYQWSGWSSAPWIIGTPVRDGEDESYQLSSLYALSLRWGDIAKEWVTCYKKPQLLRNFINQWLGETWEASHSKTTPEKVGEALRTDVPKKLIPEWGLFLTFQADRQAADGGFIVWSVMAHGTGEKSHIVDYGISKTLDDIWDSVIRHQYHHKDEGNPMAPVVGVIDSGAMTKDTYDFCNKPGREHIFPCKGSSISLGMPYKIVRLSQSKTEIDGQRLVHVDTDFWETDLQNRLDNLKPGEDGSLSLCVEASHDGEFLEQMCNGCLTDAVDNRKNAKLMWIKKDENIPNDFRDQVRYGLCIAKAWIDDRAGKYPSRSQINTRARTVISAGDSRPDGRGWLDR